MVKLAATQHPHGPFLALPLGYGTIQLKSADL
jgi:hypothetical protein